MHILVAAKQVLDPDGVGNYALWGRLAVDSSGRQFTVGNLVPQIINAYDAQAMEAALRLREAVGDCRVTAVSVGSESVEEVLKRCVAMGADAAIQVTDPEVGKANGFRTAGLLAAVVRELGDIDLVICGRQGSDYDQGTVPGVLAELLDAGLVTLASSITPMEGGVRVVRVSPGGEEIVEASFPAVITVSNEFSAARYPTSRGMIDARKKRPAVWHADELAYEDSGGVEVVEVFVPDVQGHVEWIEGSSPEEKARKLFERLVGAGVFHD